MFEELKEEIRDIIENSDGDFEDIYENSKNNSVGVKPVPNKRRITLTEKGKQVLAGAAAVLVLTSGIAIGVGAKNVAEDLSDRKQSNSVEYILQEEYPNLVLRYNHPGELEYSYKPEEIASKIKLNKEIFDDRSFDSDGRFNKQVFFTDNYNKEKFDEAVYATWFLIKTNKSKNIEDVFICLNYPTSFSDYLIAKGFYDLDENNKKQANTSAYSEYMKQEVIRQEKSESSKGLK